MTRIARNTGKSLEAQVQRAGDWYRANGKAWIERVEPSQRWVNGKPIIVRPALADFLGCKWLGAYEVREPVAIECKSICLRRGETLTLAKVLPRVQQRERLHAAASIWSVVIVIEADLGKGVWCHVANMSLIDFRDGKINPTPCGYLPNGAPDILGLR